MNDMSGHLHLKPGLAFLTGGGATGALMRAQDWNATPLGPPETWPQALKTLVGVMLAANQPMFVAWGPEHVLLYNDGYAPMLADRHPFALGRPFLAVWREVRDELTPLFDQVFAGEPVHMDDLELRLERPGRPAEAHFAFSYTPVRDERGAVVGLFCPCVETTDQVRAERNRAAAAERQRLLLQQMPGFVGVLTGPEHVYEYVNDAYVEIAGARDFVGRTVREVFPELAGQGFYELLDGVYATGESFTARAMPIRLDRDRGERFIDFLYEPVRDDAGAVTGIFVGGYDVTERVRAEAELRESEARVRLMADAVPHMLWITASDGQNEFFNRQWAEYTGQQWGATADKVAESAIHLDDQEPTLVAFKTSLETGCAFEIEHRIRSKTGEYRWFLARADAYRDPRTGEITRWYGASVDIHDRKQAERALRESEERLRAVIEAAPIGLVFADENGRITGGNSRIEEIVGHPVLRSPDLDSYREWESFHTDGRRVEGREYPLARVIAGEDRAELEVLYRRGDGRDAWVRFIAAAIRSPDLGINGGVVASLDIDRERRAELALREINADLERQVIERTLARGRMWQFTPDLLSVIDMTSATFDKVNPAWAATLGWSADELEGAPYANFVHPDDVGASAAAFEQAKRGEPVFRFDNRYRHKAGGWRWLSWVSVPEDNRLYSSSRDITEEKARAEALSARTAERDRLWRATQDIQVVIDQNGSFQAVNPAFTTILGWSADEVIGRTVFDFVIPDDAAPTEGALVQARHDVLSKFENRYRHKDGGFRWISWVATPEDELIYASGRNITAEKEQAIQLVSTQEALRQSQKMEAVGQLTGGIAHDFNNMLAVVIGSLDLLGRRLGKDDARSTRYVEAARDGARRAAQLTQRLLAFSRQQPLRPEAIDVNKLVTGMSELIRGSLGGDVRFETVLAGGGWWTHADPNQLENVLLNLAVNARDAMHDGGKLTIETQNAHLDARYASAHLGVPAGQYVLIAVSDTGTGMPEDVIAKAFDPFFTTKEVGKGTGLGLSQVYGFVRQSGGHVKIYSELDHGTTVKVYLPRLMGSHGVSTDVDALTDLPLGEAQEVILVVEDEAAVRQFSVDALTELGYRVLEADGAATALRLLNAHSEISLMFTDVVMPEMNGRKLAEAAHRRWPDLKVLFTTGYTRNAVVHNGVLDPGVQLIGKPFTVEELAAKVRDMLDSDRVELPSVTGPSGDAASTRR